MKTPTPIHVRLPSDLADRLRDEAQRETRSVNNLIVRILQERYDMVQDDAA